MSVGEADATTRATFASSGENVVKVLDHGYIVPVADGSATIKITLGAPTPVVATSGTSFGDHVRRAFRDAISTGQAIIVGFIRIVGVMTPVVLLIGLPGFLLLRFLWRRVRRRMAAPATP